MSTNTIGFQLARPSAGSGGKIPLTLARPIVAGYAEAQGAPLIVDGTGNFAACGADPDTIAAISLTPGGADTSGFNILGRKEYPALEMQGISIRGSQRFLAPYMGALPAVVGGAFGITRDVDGVWKVDFNKADKNVVIYRDNPVRSPADAAGAGQNALVEVFFNEGVVQQF